MSKRFVPFAAAQALRRVLITLSPRVSQAASLHLPCAAGAITVPAPGKPGHLRLAVAGTALLLASGMAGAFTAPAAGDFGYDVYDIVVNQILNGPIGFIGGVALIVFGATQIMKNWFSTILCIIAGTVLIRADSLVVTLGSLVG